jgi:hypothetical protein
MDHRIRQRRNSDLSELACPVPNLLISLPPEKFHVEQIAHVNKSTDRRADVVKLRTTLSCGGESALSDVVLHRGGESHAQRKERSVGPRRLLPSICYVSQHRIIPEVVR